MCSWGPSGGHGDPKQPLSWLMLWAGPGCRTWSCSCSCYVDMARDGRTQDGVVGWERGTLWMSFTDGLLDQPPAGGNAPTLSDRRAETSLRSSFHADTPARRFHGNPHRVFLISLQLVGWLDLRMSLRRHGSESLSLFCFLCCKAGDFLWLCR